MFGREQRIITHQDIQQLRQKEISPIEFDDFLQLLPLSKHTLLRGVRAHLADHHFKLLFFPANLDDVHITRNLQTTQKACSFAIGISLGWNQEFVPTDLNQSQRISRFQFQPQIQFSLAGTPHLSNIVNMMCDFWADHYWYLAEPVSLETKCVWPLDLDTNAAQSIPVYHILTFAFSPHPF